eukprot:TRINITY_DN3429_c0_g1_i2.p1 TRINITY_DN3429_c0_g1~~TRINITY_DN3429_c0_g1_i2.p1  ORF type:complete len:630 (+),score=98.74 TRINITY_DN3429_c0_g1_i2:1624-3513(+)
MTDDDVVRTVSATATNDLSPETPSAQLVSRFDHVVEQQLPLEPPSAEAKSSALWRCFNRTRRRDWGSLVHVLSNPWMFLKATEQFPASRHETSLQQSTLFQLRLSFAQSGFLFLRPSSEDFPSLLDFSEPAHQPFLFNFGQDPVVARPIGGFVSRLPELPQLEPTVCSSTSTIDAPRLLATTALGTLRTSLTIPSIALWDRAGLGPHCGAKNVTFCAAFNTESMSQSAVVTLLRELSAVYDLYGLGSHIPLLPELERCIFSFGAAGPDPFAAVRKLLETVEPTEDGEKSVVVYILDNIASLGWLSEPMLQSLRALQTSSRVMVTLELIPAHLFPPLLPFSAVASLHMLQAYLSQSQSGPQVLYEPPVGSAMTSTSALADIALAVYSKIRRFPVSQDNSRLLFEPPVILDANPEVLTLHGAYCVLGGVVALVWTDSVGELLETVTVPFVSSDSWEEMANQLWAASAAVFRLVNSPFHVVITRTIFGGLNALNLDPEMAAWQEVAEIDDAHPLLQSVSLATFCDKAAIKFSHTLASDGSALVVTIPVRPLSADFPTTHSVERVYLVSPIATLSVGLVWQKERRPGPAPPSVQQLAIDFHHLSFLLPSVRSFSRLHSLPFHIALLYRLSRFR